MTHQDKSYFCALAAALLAPPRGETVEQLRQEEVRSFLAEHVREWNGDGRLLDKLLSGQPTEHLLPALEKEYARLFSDFQGERISLVESTYKPWTSDEGCGLAFARSKGLLMGDCALHMRDLFRQLSLETPEEFSGTPDHLVLELEFLSLLYGSATHAQVQGFIEEHLDWISDLKDRVAQSDPHPFYRHALDIISLFLQKEKKTERRWIIESQNLY